MTVRSRIRTSAAAMTNMTRSLLRQTWRRRRQCPHGQCSGAVPAAGCWLVLCWHPACWRLGPVNCQLSGARSHCDGRLMSTIIIPDDSFINPVSLLSTVLLTRSSQRYHELPDREEWDIQQADWSGNLDYSQPADSDKCPKTVHAHHSTPHTRRVTGHLLKTWAYKQILIMKILLVLLWSTQVH